MPLTGMVAVILLMNQITMRTVRILYPLQIPILKIIVLIQEKVVLLGKGILVIVQKWTCVLRFIPLKFWIFTQSPQRNVKIFSGPMLYKIEIIHFEASQP